MNEKTRTMLYWLAAGAVVLAILAFFFGRILPGARVALPSEPISHAEETTAGLVNINTASVEELTALPGIGKATATEIVRYRTEVGPFTSIYDLEDISGIGETKMQTLEPLVTVE